MRIFNIFNKRKLKAFLLKKLLLNSPVSNVFGFDRGTPIDRYYIERFLFNNKSKIKGDVLEIAERTYTEKFGADNVDNSMVLSYEKAEGVDIVGDLATGEGLQENIADCFIFTQTLPFVKDVKAVLSNTIKMLKPGGYLLLTVPGITQLSVYDYERWGHYWTFTDQGVKELVRGIDYASIESIQTFGNVKVASAFLFGYSCEEFSKDDLDMVDYRYQVSITAVIQKKKLC